MQQLLFIPNQSSIKMSAIARRGLKRVSTILHSLKNMLIDKPEAREEALEKVEEVLKEIDREIDRLPTLAAGSLRLSEVVEILRLSVDKRSRDIWRLENNDIITVPEALRKFISYMVTSYAGSDFPTSKILV